MTNTIEALDLNTEGDFATDGVVCVRGLVSAAPSMGRASPTRWPRGCSQLWFFFEQVFLETGGETRRTPWHQDASYVPMKGHHQAVVWIPLAAVRRDRAVEFVRGSHLGPIYQISNLDPYDDTAPDRPGLDRRRLPDIEAARDNYDILSWELDTGDVLIFHLATLHGGAATSAGSERRTVSLRFFGPDARFEPLKGVAYGAQARDGNAPVTANPMAEMYAELVPGGPFSAGSWPLVRSNGRAAH